METHYLIAWKCNANGRIGRGKTLMGEGEAQKLAADLNKEHPDFEHIVVHKNTETVFPLFSQEPPNSQIIDLFAMKDSSQKVLEPKPWCFPPEPETWHSQKGVSEDGKVEPEEVESSQSQELDGEPPQTEPVRGAA